ncbi:MAG TPA: BatA and WFA domain-containing protein [Candidatus Limnocylindria bacterium]|nr:BatA and WFA domain-containing protein [Candidatus Limnocylindria bacterium]
MIAPLALIGLVALPVIVAFYMLRLRRRDVPVGSTFLWQQLVRDVEANAPWQRLRFSWLLLLQLLIALLVVVAAARPFTALESQLTGNVVLIVDTSASMGALDGGEPRVEAARAAARRVVDSLPVGGRITVVAADDTAHVLVSETDDRAAARAAIDRVTATQLPGDLTDAFALASALARRDPDSTVVVVTDATADRLPPVGIGAPIVVERVGSSGANQAIAALSLARRSGGAQVDLFVAVSNPSAADVSRRLEIYADGELADARELRIPAGQRSEALVTTVPPDAATVEARLAGGDALGVDDSAFALVPREAAIRALLVSEGNTYLESALALLPRLELYAVEPGGYADAVAEADEAGTPYRLFVYDRFEPQAHPEAPALYVAPAADGPYGTVGAQLDAPGLARTSGDEPVLRFVDIATLHVGRARQVTLAEGMRDVVATTEGHPLLAVGRVDGEPVGLITFALGESDLPLQVAFPLLMSNLVDFLLPPGEGVLPPSVALGEPLALALDPSLELAVVSDPSGEREIALTGGRATLPAATRVGIRELRTVDGAVLGRTAANLFQPDESDVTPGDPRRLEEMGRPAPSGAEATESRLEWWWPLALLALLLLLAEWLVFHRPTRRSIDRALGRPRSGPAVRASPAAREP